MPRLRPTAGKRVKGAKVIFEFHKKIRINGQIVTDYRQIRTRIVLAALTTGHFRLIHPLESF